MKRTLFASLAVLVACMGCSPPAFAQQPAVLYDVKAKDTLAVVGYKAKELPEFLGTKQSAEVWALGAYAADTGTARIGFAMVLPFRIARNATAYVGGAWTTARDRKAGLGVVFGFAFGL